MTRFWDGRTDGQSDCTPRPAFAFGDAGKNQISTPKFSIKTPHLPPLSMVEFKTGQIFLYIILEVNINVFRQICTCTSIYI